MSGTGPTMPTPGIPNRLIDQIENYTAAMLSARDALRQLELFVRAQRRRGYIDADDLTSLEQDLETLRTAIGRNLDYTRFARGNLGEAMK
jgi:hypothetical protein